MTKYKGQADEIEKKEKALDICMDGLEDEDTHLSSCSLSLHLFHPFPEY